jgi:hypothetical protein
VQRVEAATWMSPATKNAGAGEKLKTSVTSVIGLSRTSGPDDRPGAGDPADAVGTCAASRTGTTPPGPGPARPAPVDKHAGGYGWIAPQRDRLGSSDSS